MDVLPLADVRVLVMEGQDGASHTLSEVLRGVGASVTNGRGNVARQATRPDVVVLDLDESGEAGPGLVECSRCWHPTAAILLLTASRNVDVAAVAAGLDGTRVLLRPFDAKALQDAVRDAARDARLAALRSEAFARVCTRSGADSACEQLDGLLPGVHLAWQPIVATSNNTTIGYEALARTGREGVGPVQLLQLAESAGRLVDLGRRLRAMVALDAARLPPDALLFVNLHSGELGDDALLGPGEALAPFARRTVLEITQRASIASLVDAADRVSALRARGYRIAIDDIGAGYAGLTSMANFSPEFAKLDISLVRGIDGDPARRHLVRAIAAVCAHLRIPVVAEGVETQGELDTATNSACTHAQGYFIGRPMPIGRLG